MKKAISIFLSALILFMTPVFSASAQESDIVFSKNQEASKKIALTFDDGPHPRFTEKILNVLEKYDIKATFFVIGVNIENYPAPLKRIVQSGHEIGNHSYTHANQKALSEENIRCEIEKCENLIYESVGVKAKLFRPPQGQYGEGVEKIAREKGCSIILWSIDTKDWEHNPAKSIEELILSSIGCGDIILMHDYTSGKNSACEALEMIIPELLSKGYEFVTVSELLKSN